MGIFGTLNESDSISPKDEDNPECTNPECIDGMMPEYVLDDYNEWIKEMVRCKCQR